MTENSIQNKDFAIVIVEDDKNLAYLIQKKLSRLGYNVSVCHSGQEAIESALQTPPSLFLIDYRLVDMLGIEVINFLSAKKIRSPFIIMTGFGDEKIAVEMMKLGAQDYLVKDQNFLEILLPVLEKVKDQLNLERSLFETKASLVKSEIRFKALIENSSDIISIINRDGEISYCSPSIENILGYNHEYLVGKKFVQFIAPYDIDRMKEKLTQLTLMNTKQISASFSMRSANGSFRIIEGTIKNLLDDHNINGIVANLRDITLRVRTEEKIKKLLHAVDQSSVMISISDKSGKIEYINPKFSEITGYNFDELYNRTPRFFLEDLLTPYRFEELWHTINDGKEWKGEFQNKNKNGKVYWESISVSPIFNNEQNITHFLTISENITDKKISENKLKIANEFYLTLFEDSPTMIWRCDSSGKKNYFNKTWLRFRGNTLEQELDEGWQNGVHHDNKKEYFEKFNNSFKNKEPFRILYQLQKFDGEFRWIAEFGKPFYDIDGFFAGVIGTCLDVTDTKKAEETMRLAKEAAEKSEALKTEFLAQMSHEIRTPINAILSFTSLLRYELEDKVEDDLKESFRIIDKGGRRLIRTIDLLLHMSEIQTGNYEIVKKEIDLHSDVINIVLLELMNQANTKNINMMLYSNYKSSMINADEHSVMQIFENLIDNAIKYNHDKGKIEINIYNNADSKLCVDIKDSGIGISKEFLPSLFEPFTQEESGYTRKFEGNGLGLALVKKYCEINDAEIEVKSAKGEGSIFTVIFKN